MKKILAMILVIALALACLNIAVFAEDADLVPSDENIEKVPTFTGGVSPSVWLNKFDADDECIGFAAATFNAGAAFYSISLQSIWAGVSDKGQDSTIEVSLYKFDKDYATSVAGQHVYQASIYLNGDQEGSIENEGIVFETGKQAAGQYVLLIKQTSPRGDAENAPYSVLPAADSLYTDLYIEYEGAGVFAFIVNFEKTEGVTEYFKKLQGNETVSMDIKPSKTIIERTGGAQEINSMGEYAILTPEVPDGNIIYSFTFKAAPTWANTNGDSDLYYEVYKWKGDYDSCFSSKPVTSGTIYDHKDNSDLLIRFGGTALRYGYRYLIVFTADNDGKVGFWEGSISSAPEGWEFFVSGDESEICPAFALAYAVTGDLGPEPTEAPTPEPTATPEVTATPEATEAPTAAPTAAPTDAPKPTEAPAKSGCGSVIGGAAILAVLAAAVVLKKKH